MPNNDQWMTTRVAETREKHPLVTDAVAARIASLLNGELSERPLAPAQLAVVARDSITDMGTAPPMVEAKQ